MATLLDVTLLGKFSNLMMFLLVFVISYAAFQLTNLIKNKSLNAFISFLIAFFTLLNHNVTQLVSFIIPWLFVILLVLVFILILMITMGTKTTDVQKAMSHWGPFHITLLGFVGLVLIIAFSQVYGSYFLQLIPGSASSTAVNSTNTTSPGGNLAQNVMRIFVTPQVLSLALVFIIAALAVMWLTFPP